MEQRNASSRYFTKLCLNTSIPNASLDTARKLLIAGKPDQAASVAHAYLKQNPHDPRAWHLLSLAHAKSGKLSLAQTSIAQAIALAPEDIGLRLQHGQYLIAGGQRREALSLAISLSSVALPRPDWNDALGTLYALCDEPLRARPLFELAVTQSPLNSEYKYNLAAIQRMTGDLIGAEETLNAVIASQPSNAYAYYTRSDLRTQSRKHNNIQQMRDALEKYVHKHGDRILMYFAIGKELDDIGEYSSAFEYFRLGADSQRRTFTYDVTDDTAVIDRIIERHTSETLGGARGYECDECIFVLGLPRTGTTLTEQVLSSHSQVFGAGELQAFPLSVISAARSRAGSQVPKRELVDLSLELDPFDLGKAYIEATRPQTGQTRRFVDKQSANFLYAGLIARALPNARFIGIVRDPVDSCFAMYRTLFTGAYPFSYTVPELARYYAAWHKLMRHWQGVLGSRLLLVRYEQLVAEFEPTARRMLDHCGLQWEDGVRTFHQSKRAVTTASATQVRKPIYASSVGRWRNYEAQLGPLLDELARLAPQSGWNLD